MVRRGSVLRALLVPVLVGLTSLGLVVSSAGTAQALQPGPAERVAVKALGGLVQGGAPSVLKRVGGKCKPGPALAACVGGTALLAGAAATSPMWYPWLANKVGIGQEEISDPQEACAAGTFQGFPCSAHGVISFKSVQLGQDEMRHRATFVARVLVSPLPEYKPWELWSVPVTADVQCWNGTQTTWLSGFQFRLSDWGDISDPDGGKLSGSAAIQCSPGQRLEAIRLSPGVRNHGGGGFYTYTNKRTWFAPNANDGAVRLEIECLKASDGTTYTRTVTNAPESDDGKLIQFPACDAGDIMVRSRGWSASNELQWDNDLRPTAEEVAEDKRLYPACSGGALGNASCQYQIAVDGKPCLEGTADCAAWTRIRTANPSRVECFYGPYSISVDQCGWLERAYETDPNKQTATEENTDGDPETGTAPVPQPATTTAPTPAPSTGSNCLTGSLTCQPVPSPNLTTTEVRECWPTGWGAFNPGNWVLQPIKCAFQPRPSVVTEVQTRVRTAVDGTGVPALVGAVTVPVLNVPSGSGCQGPGITFPSQLREVGFPSQTMYPVSACAAPLSTAALVVRSLSTVVIVVGGGLTIIRMIGAGFGYNVAFRSGGGD